MTSFLLSDLVVGHQSFSLFASQESCLAGAGWDTGDTTAKVLLSEGNSWIVCLISYWVVTVEYKITAMQLATG